MPDPDATMALATTTTSDTPHVLPEGWRLVQLRDVIAEAQPGFASGERDEQGILQLRMNNVDTRGNIVWDREVRVPGDQQTAARYLLVPGDVLFNNTNSTELVGKNALYQGHNEPVVFSNHFTRLRPVPTQLDSAYLANWLLMEWQSRTFERLCNQWVGQSAVKNDKLLALSIPLPPLAEQRRIAAILAERMAAVERARAATQAQLDAAKALSAAELRAVFESEEAQAWPKVRLESILLVGSLNGLAPRPNDTPPGYPLLRISAGTSRDDALVDESDFKYLDVDEDTIAKYRLQPGDLLACRFNGNLRNVGKFSLYRGYSGLTHIYPDKLIRFRLNPSRALPDYVVLAMNSSEMRMHIEAICDTTAGNIGVSATELRNIEMPLPPLTRQRAIAERYGMRMDNIKRLRTALEAQLDAINALPAALLRQAFNGEL